MIENNTKIAILLGGNLGNVPQTFQFALRRLAELGVKKLCCSAILRNRAVDCPPGTPDFCNAAAIGEWSGTPEELLAATQTIEQEAGRPAEHGHNTSRTLDLDIILFGNLILATKQLTIPHLRATERDFVLIPLAEIAPDWMFPNCKKTVRVLLRDLRKQSNGCIVNCI